ncbi:DUF4349 domain-containing protein [Microcella alkalica]|uniref:DUF4349 domain-containing protein n=1 Tax=Microcella alkalica TaxID=355930 RepID=UPI00145C5233|nr:DUF4349 domain-containing protein [Microcella alkalica]
MRRRSPAPHRPARPTRAALALVVGLLVAAPLLAGCGAARNESTDSGWFTGGGEAPSVVDPGAPDGEGGGSGGDGDLGEQGGDRERIVTGSLYVTVDEPLAAADEATRIVERAGGRVDGRREYAASGRASGDGDSGAPAIYDENGQYLGSFPGGGAVLELRIPSERLSGVIDDLEALGEPEELVLSTDDVTVAVRDLEARISALRASVERLLALQSQAADLDDLLALESAISDRQAELESLEAQQRYYADQVSLSTITLTLGSQEVAPVDEPNSFLTGLATGWDALLAFLGGALVALGVLLPWLLPLGLLALVVLLVLRARRRRRAARDAATEVAGGAAPTTPVPTPEVSR